MNALRMGQMPGGMDREKMLQLMLQDQMQSMGLPYASPGRGYDAGPGHPAILAQLMTQGGGDDGSRMMYGDRNIGYGGMVIPPEAMRYMQGKGYK